MNDNKDDIDRMLTARTYAVVGASTNPEKYGHKAYALLKAYGKTVYPINPRADAIDGDKCYPSVSALPEVPEVVVAIVPPTMTETLIDELAQAGVKNVWMQPGAESEGAARRAQAAGITAVYGGPCILVGVRTHLPRPKPQT